MEVVVGTETIDDTDTKIVTVETDEKLGGWTLPQRWSEVVVPRPHM